MEKILVGFDDAESSVFALKRAAEFAKAFGAQLHVVSVVPIVASVGRSSGAIDPMSNPAEHQRQLDEARERLQSLSLTADYHSAVGDPAKALVELGEELDVDLIIVGTREPSMLARLFGQSVSDSVARQTHRDLLIVHRDPAP